MGFMNLNIGGRDTRISVTKPSVSYNDDGIEVIDSNTTIEFWGKVIDQKDAGGDSTYSAYKRLESLTIAIEVDSRTIESVSILDTLTTDQGSQSYEVIDIYQSTWKFTSMIIAKHKS